MKYFIRPDWRDDNHNSDHLIHGEPVEKYSTAYDPNALQNAVEELADRGGGYVHDENGDAIKFVAPIARR